MRNFQENKRLDDETVSVDIPGLSRPITKTSDDREVGVGI